MKDENYTGLTQIAGTRPEGFSKLAFREEFS
jgi:hypothetical protein